MNKITSIILTVIVSVIVSVGIISLLPKETPPVGTNVITDKHIFKYGIWAGSPAEQVINAEGDLTLTSGTTTLATTTVGLAGTALKNIICVSTTTDWANLVAGACTYGTTSMTGITVPGSGSTGWSFYVSPIATTSGIETGTNYLGVMAYATSTNMIALRVCNNATNTAVNLPVQYYEVCGIQH